jgi:hypothetical protein
MPDSELGSRDDRPIVLPPRADDDSGLELFTCPSDSKPRDASTGHLDDCGLIDV